jgi:hypothetical protein
VNPALHISYDDQIMNFAARNGRIDPSTGAHNLTTGDLRMLSVWISTAIEEAWNRPRGKDWVWPFLVNSATLTVTSGIIALADISYGPWISLWSADPRTANSNAYRVPVRVIDASGIYPQCDLGSVFGLYVARVPEFSSTQWSGATSYVTGDVVYDSTTGQCWRAKTAVTGGTGIVLSNATYWEEQLIPRQFGDYLTWSCLSMARDAAGQEQTAERLANSGLEALEREFIAAFRDSPTGSGKPFYVGGLWR